MNTLETSVVKARYSKSQGFIKSQFSIKKEFRNERKLIRERVVSATLLKWLKN
ncbi:MAG TPA: hypothetical protein VK213_13535 [Bacteroidales bacterium]|nr:hypothetical protein [Bacteroidales bacterium]